MLNSLQEHFSIIKGHRQAGKIEHAIVDISLSAAKNTRTANVIPLFKMIDFSEQKVLAGEAARQALSMTDRFDSVVLAAMN